MPNSSGKYGPPWWHDGIVRIVEVYNGLGNGGAEIAMIRRLGHQPPNIDTIIISKGPVDSAIRNEIQKSGVKLIDYSDASESFSLRKSIARLNPDIVVVHTPLIAIEILLLSLFVRFPPVVIVAHADIVSDKKQFRKVIAFILQRLNRRATMHIAVSEPAANGPWCRHAARIEICHLGSSIEAESTIDDWLYWSGSAKIRLLSISRLAEPKNLINLVKSVGILADFFRTNSVELSIVGDGPIRQILEQAIRSSLVSDLVSLQPSTKEVGALMSAADWLIIASTNEGGPLTAYEASLAGTRIASTKVGAVPAVIKGDPFSFTVDGHGVEELNSLLRQAIEMGPCGKQERQERKSHSDKWSTRANSEHWYRILSELERQ
jgi:glycosyltransferase involved in cell wall biosynthesis